MIARLALFVLLAMAGGTGSTLQEGSGQWLRRPTSDELAACAPEITEPPITADITLTCQVGADGRLTQCRVETPDDRLTDWAICVSHYLIAAEPHRGAPLRFKLGWRTD